MPPFALLGLLAVKGCRGLRMVLPRVLQSLGQLNTTVSMIIVLRLTLLAATANAARMVEPVTLAPAGVAPSTKTFTVAALVSGNSIDPKLTEVHCSGWRDQEAACAVHSPADTHPSNFGQLRVYTNPAYSNKQQMQAAGYVEGYATADLIWHYWRNMRWWLENNADDVNKIYGWLGKHDDWLQQQLKRNPRQWPHKERVFWEALSLVMAQFEGMKAGYAARVQQEGAALGIKDIPATEWLALNTLGDMDDLMDMFSEDKPLSQLSPAELRTKLASRGRCSVLIKVTPDLNDLLMGHVTWWTYTSMIRLYKHYHLELHGEQYKTRLTSMSSYPGLISSMDDFYILNSQLVVTETSNDIMDKSLYRKVVPQAALSWQRVLVANLLSTTGAEWAHWLEQHNSGTYNNQYMVVDLKRFTPGQELQPGLLTVVEQIPGMVVWSDQTQELERGYWPSYNVPFHGEVYRKSGYPDAVKNITALGPGYEDVVAGLSYQLAPRAKLARRDSSRVTDLHSLKAYMRGNNWSKDPLSGGSPWGAQCARGDLDPSDATASGCYDAKVTNVKMALRNAAEAVSGPTLGSGLGVFRWSGKWDSVAHEGMPDAFDFKFELQEP